MAVLAEKLRNKVQVKHVIITLNKDGILIHTEPNRSWVVDKLPAFSSNAIDPSGGGDCFMVVSALALSCDVSIWEASFLGSIAAKIQVNRSGNKPVTLTELQNEIT